MKEIVRLVKLFVVGDVANDKLSALTVLVFSLKKMACFICVATVEKNNNTHMVDIQIC